MESLKALFWAPFLFLLYINDLPHALLDKATPILFAADTSLIITGQNTSSFQEDINVIFGQISQWFQDNWLSLNISETNFMYSLIKLPTTMI